MNATLIPHVGIGSILLYSSYEEILQILNKKGLRYKIEIQDNSHCTVNFNWRIVVVEGCVKLFFSEGNYKLFKITVVNTPSIKLPNGVHVGMKLSDAIALDPILSFQEWDEIYESSSDYYLEDSLASGLVVSITIYIKELNEDDFDYCKW